MREELARTDDARSLLRNLFCSEADLLPDLEQRVLRVQVHPMSNPRANREIAHLLEHLNAAEFTYPGTKLQLVYSIVRKSIATPIPGASQLLELVDRGFAPKATIADFGSGLRAGHQEALPEVPCRGDVFHALYDVGPLARYLENRAYEAIDARAKLERKQATAERRHGRKDQSLAKKLSYARPAEAKAIALADEVALLARWLRDDILSVAGPEYAIRRDLLDFVVAELRARESACPHRIRPVRTLLEKQRDNLLAFAVELDRELAALAQEWQISLTTAREVLQVQSLPTWDPKRWRREAALRATLRGRYHGVCADVQELSDRVVRASSLVENLNSRLRSYFFLRRQLGKDYLTLLQFFLNHRRYLRSEDPSRVGKSPAELLTGEPHAHWLELLGYTRFSRN